MRLLPTKVDGAMIVEFEGHSDDRGYFARTFCVREFRKAGIAMEVVQIGI